MINSLEIPDVPFSLLTSLPLTRDHWIKIAQNASWQTTRMNLNTFERHGVFEDQETVKSLADRLRDRAEIKRSKVFPYQLLIAYQNATSAPRIIREALQDALEIATENVPALHDQGASKVWVFIDVSGSMHSPVTGVRKGSNSKVSCVDVASLITACIVRKNLDASVMAFSDNVVAVNLNPRDTVITNAQKLMSLPSGGTNCSAPMIALEQSGKPADLIIYVSDNQSWIDNSRSNNTETYNSFKRIKAKQPDAKLICINLQPYADTQAQESTDVLNIGGFSDSIFDLISAFINGGNASENWLKQIEAIQV